MRVRTPDDIFFFILNVWTVGKSDCVSRGEKHAKPAGGASNAIPVSRCRSPDTRFTFSSRTSAGKKNEYSYFFENVPMPKRAPFSFPVIRSIARLPSLNKHSRFRTQLFFTLSVTLFFPFSPSDDLDSRWDVLSSPIFHAFEVRTASISTSICRTVISVGAIGSLQMCYRSTRYCGLHTVCLNPFLFPFPFSGSSLLPNPVHKYSRHNPYFWGGFFSVFQLLTS